jgi:hypothetical protein
LLSSEEDGRLNEDGATADRAAAGSEENKEITMLDRLRGAFRFANVISVLALVFAMGGGAYAITSISGGGGRIHGCYQKNNGNLRVVGARKKCLKGEKPIVWNQTGRQGQPGAPGAAGAAGANGTNGANGANGVTGPAGSAAAYADIASDGTVNAPNSKNVTAVTNPGGAGIYCLQVSVTPRNAVASVHANESGFSIAATDIHPSTISATCGATLSSANVVVTTYTVGTGFINRGFYLAIN